MQQEQEAEKLMQSTQHNHKMLLFVIVLAGATLPLIIKMNHHLTFPRSVSRSALPFNTVELELCDEKLLLKVTSRSASGVVTVLARPSTAAFSSYSFLKISSWRASRALIAGSTSPFWKQEKKNIVELKNHKWKRGRKKNYRQFSPSPSFYEVCQVSLVLVVPTGSCLMHWWHWYTC